MKVDDWPSPPGAHDMPAGHLRARQDHLIGEARHAMSRKPLDWSSFVGGWRPSRRYVGFGGLLALIAVLATPAFGLTSRMRDLFEGTPATPLVQQHFSTLSNAFTAANREAAAGTLAHLPSIDSSRTRGVLAVTSDHHQLNLWVAPTDDGSGCWLIQIDGEAQPANTLYGPSGCFNPKSPEVQGKIAWTEFANDNLPELRLLAGQVFVSASYVEAQLAGGATLRIPVVEHFFLATLDRDSTTTRITAYDEGGTRTAESTQGMVIR